VTAELATSLFPNTDPIGQRVRLGGQSERLPERLLEVIGVVANAKLAEPHATNHLLLFTVMRQAPVRSL
jgi:hypothetical protein